MRAIREECLNRLILFGERRLRRASLRPGALTSGAELSGARQRRPVGRPTDQAEQETVLRWDREGDYVHVWSASPVTWAEVRPARHPADPGDDLSGRGLGAVRRHPRQPIPLAVQAGRDPDARTACSGQEHRVDVSSDPSEPPMGSPHRLQGEPRPEPPIWRPRPGRGRVGAPVPHRTAGAPSSGGGPGAVTRCPGWRSRSGLGRRSVCDVPGASMRIARRRSSARRAAAPHGLVFSGPPAAWPMPRSRALTESREQQTATAEILRVISSSPTDVQPVFDAIARSAIQLCDSPSALWFLSRDGPSPRCRDSFDPGGPRGPPPHVADAVMAGSSAGRAVLSRIVEHVALDVYAAGWPSAPPATCTRSRPPQHRRGSAASRRDPYRGDHGRALRARAVLRRANRDAPDLRLPGGHRDRERPPFKELEMRNRDLTEALEQQTATGEILRVISRLPTDVQPVFDTIVQRGALVRCIHRRRDSFRRRADPLGGPHNFTPEALEITRHSYPSSPAETVGVGRFSIGPSATSPMSRGTRVPEPVTCAARPASEACCRCRCSETEITIGAIAVARAARGPSPRSRSSCSRPSPTRP